MELKNELRQFREAVTVLKSAAECKEPSRKLLSGLVAYGFTDVTEVTIYHVLWNAMIDLLKEALVQVYLSDLKSPMTLASSDSLRSLTQDITCNELDAELYCIVRTYTRLQELNLSTRGRNVLLQFEPIAQQWHGSPRPFTLTLLLFKWPLANPSASAMNVVRLSSRRLIKTPPVFKNDHKRPLWP